MVSLLACDELATVLDMRARQHQAPVAGLEADVMIDGERGGGGGRVGHACERYTPPFACVLMPLSARRCALRPARALSPTHRRCVGRRNTRLADSPATGARGSRRARPGLSRPELTPRKSWRSQRCDPEWDDSVPMEECAGPFSTAQATGVYGVGAGGNGTIAYGNMAEMPCRQRWKLPAFPAVQIQCHGVLRSHHGVDDGELVPRSFCRVAHRLVCTTPQQHASAVITTMYCIGRRKAARRSSHLPCGSRCPRPWQRARAPSPPPTTAAFVP